LGFTLICALAVVAAVNPPEIGLSVNIARDASDLLAPVTISITLRNPTQIPVTASFLTTDLYQVEIRDEQTELWSSLFGHSAVDIERRVPLRPGVTPLGALVWDGTTNDHRSLAPGTYIVRVSILGTLVHPSADVAIRFATPMPIASAKTLAAGSAVTVAGITQRVDGVPILTDDEDSIHLSRVTTLRAQGHYIVRGYIVKSGDAITLSVERAAPAFDNLDPESTPPPPRPAMTFPPIPRGSGAPLPRSSGAPIPRSSR
jgi:hypothetical protein